VEHTSILGRMTLALRREEDLKGASRLPRKKGKGQKKELEREWGTFKKKGKVGKSEIHSSLDKNKKNFLEGTGRKYSGHTQLHKLCQPS